MQRGYNKMGGQTLRVFLSSTFRDMNGERDTFVQKYLPALRQHCAELGLFLSIVDLRWGVTVEQAQSGEVVPICMSEVEACQYFVFDPQAHRPKFYSRIPGASSICCPLEDSPTMKWAPDFCKNPN